MKIRLLPLILTIGLMQPTPAQSFSLSKPVEFCKEIVGRFDIYAFGKDCAIAYGIMALDTIAHEAGHALTNRLFYGWSKKINIGGHPGDPCYLRLPGIDIRGMNPNMGYTMLQSPEPNGTKIDYLKSMIISLAGPICGIVSSAVMLTLLCKSSGRHSMPKLAACYSIFLDICNMIPQVFVINGQNISNDGYKFYDSYKKYRALQNPAALSAS